MKTKSVLGLMAVICVVIFASCDRNRVFDAYVPVPDKGWSKDSMAYFVVDVPSIEQSMNLYINIRNTPQYTNSNLWLFIDVKSPSGKLERDTIECILADVQGKWLGKGWGSLYHLKAPYMRSVKFAEHGKYEFKISHGMRSPELKGIQDIGLRVEKAQ
jgi:gliding motility-associated lipoprotein GldH